MTNPVRRESLLPASKPVAVLHVEDDPDFADLVATSLERIDARFEVTTETDPRAALDRVRAGEPVFDCVVSDYDMPGMNGLDVLEAVRTDRSELPFILFTGKGSEEIASEAISAGVTDYLQKGGGMEKYQVLANRILNAVEAYRAERYADRGLQAIETARDGIAILDEGGHIQYLNTAWAELLGYDREELLGVHWEALYETDAVAQVYDELLPRAREGGWRGRTTFLRKDDSLVDVDHTLTYTDDGSLICTISSAGEPTVVGSATMYERAVEEAPVGIVVADPSAEDNPIVYANERFRELTGYDEEEVLGRNCRFLQGPETSEEPVRRMRTAIEEAEPVTVEVLNYRRDGTAFWNRVRIAPLVDEDGDAELFVGFQEDVTERNADERRLRETTARLEALFEHSPDMIAIHDADGVIRDVNRRMCETLGFDESELVGKTVWEIDTATDETRARAFWRELPTNSPRRFEGRLQRKDGTTIPVEVHLIRLDVEGEDLFVGMDRDISDQKAREAELVHQNEQLDRFTSVVSHDLRNPLQVAEGRLELLREECDSPHLDPIERSLGRMDTLIEDLLTLAHGRGDSMELVSVDIASLVRDCWEMVQTEDAALVVEAELTIEADRPRLRQLFENLIRNAIEHAGTDATVTVGSLPDGFYVEDDGPGIPESEREAIFEFGYSTRPSGTGFGLNIVEQVAEAHGWELTVTEGSDGGARFEFTGIRT
ncbi:PAS domain S-box protein [Natronomonas sp. EA1]|uniref:PAS domain S-box protein n=1 Tax=Natronomonas sp. EA1 TaxID=3421655 RepID=UPI003EBFECE2